MTQQDQTPIIQQNKAPEIVKISRNRRIFTSKDRRDSKQDYQKFMMSVYQTAGKRQIKIRKQQKNLLKQIQKDQAKMTYFQFPQYFPKLINTTNSQIQISPEIEKGFNSSKVIQNNKAKVLKSFINNYQEIKKKTQIHNMNILGLQIKKLDCYQKKKDITKKSQPCITYEQDMNKSIYQIIDKQKTQITQSIGCMTKRLSVDQKENVQHHISDDQQELNNQSEEKQLNKLLKMEFCSQFQQKKQKRHLSLCNHSQTQARQKYVYFHEKVKKMKLSNNNNENLNKIYEKRINSYRDFIFKIHFAHNVYLNYFKKEYQNNGMNFRNQHKYKVWIGSGNNSSLIKILFKRRFWWQILPDKSLDINFIWTQIKVNQVYKKQKGSRIQIQMPKKQHDTLSDSQEQDNKKSKLNKKSMGKYQKKKQITPDYLFKIFNQKDEKIYKEYSQKYQQKTTRPIEYKKQHIKKELIILSDPSKFIVHNHLQNNFFLGNKKAMFYNLKQYYQLIEQNVFDYLPLTFHIKHGIKDNQYRRFLYYYKKRAALIKKQQKALEDGEIRKGFKMPRNIWIVKPGQLSNRGNGITVIDQIYQVNSILNKKQIHTNGTLKTYIVQLYIDRPFLYNRRKFDIRHYMLITNMYGIMRGYWYSEGYIRTTSYQFDIFNFERQIHLTNDAVQKYTPLYGKYQPGNKISYSQFQRYLDSNYPKKNYSFANQILPKMKKFARDSIKSACLKLSPNNLQHNFQIFGLDFMIDQNFHPWLIEINTNPCLQLSCPLLQRIIPGMVQQSLRLGVDVIYPPPTHYVNTLKHLAPDASLQNLKYELIFDSQVDGDEIKEIYKNIKMNKMMAEIGQISQQQQYADEGFQIKLDDL